MRPYIDMGGGVCLNPTSKLNLIPNGQRSISMTTKMTIYLNVFPRASNRLSLAAALVNSPAKKDSFDVLCTMIDF